METKLYVGNLPFASTEDSPRTLLPQAGSMTDAAIIKYRMSGRSKGFAFVQMSRSEDAENAIKVFNGFSLKNRELKVNKAKPREEGDRGPSLGGFRQDRGSGRGYGNPAGTKPGRGFSRSNDRGFNRGCGGDRSG